MNAKEAIEAAYKSGCDCRDHGNTGMCPVAFPSGEWLRAIALLLDERLHTNSKPKQGTPEWCLKKLLEQIKSLGYPCRDGTAEEISNAIDHLSSLKLTYVLEEDFKATREKLDRILVKMQDVKDMGWSGPADLDARITALFDELPKEKP